MREVEFDESKRIGQYPSYDLFGDGSFYILDVPGVSPPYQHSAFSIADSEAHSV